MIEYWDKPLKVGKTDVYYARVSEKWRETESLTNQSVASTDTNVATVGTTELVGDEIIKIPLTGVSPGLVQIDVDYDTATRSDSAKIFLNVSED